MGKSFEHNGVFAAVAMAVEKISLSAEQRGSPEEVLHALHSSFVSVGLVDDSCAALYSTALQKAVEEKGRVGGCVFVGMWMSGGGMGMCV